MIYFLALYQFSKRGELTFVDFILLAAGAVDMYLEVMVREVEKNDLNIQYANLGGPLNAPRFQRCRVSKRS